MSCPMNRFWIVISLFFLASCAPQGQVVPPSPKSDQKTPIVAPVVEPIVAPIVDEPRQAQLLVPREAVPQPVPPPEINLAVPFYPQAPNGFWSLPWQEACEEASSILAYCYVSGKSLTLELFKKELNGLFEWQNKNFGDYKDTTIEQTAQMIRGYWGFDRLRVIENPTIDQIKEALAHGNPVIAPFAGRDLKNPFYSNQGPYYHMLVIKGYDSKNFITNDVGTKKGADYRYPFAHLMSAMHEWDPKDIHQGAKRVIVVEKAGN